MLKTRTQTDCTFWMWISQIDIYFTWQRGSTSHELCTYWHILHKTVGLYKPWTMYQLYTSTYTINEVISWQDPLQATNQITTSRNRKIRRFFFCRDQFTPKPQVVSSPITCIGSAAVHLDTTHLHPNTTYKDLNIWYLEWLATRTGRPTDSILHFGLHSPAFVSESECSS